MVQQARHRIEQRHAGDSAGAVAARRVVDERRPEGVADEHGALDPEPAERLSRAPSRVIWGGVSRSTCRAAAAERRVQQRREPVGRGRRAREETLAEGAHLDRDELAAVGRRGGELDRLALSDEKRI